MGRQQSNDLQVGIPRRGESPSQLGTRGYRLELFQPFLGVLAAGKEKVSHLRTDSGRNRGHKVYYLCECFEIRLWTYWGNQEKWMGQIRQTDQEKYFPGSGLGQSGQHLSGLGLGRFYLPWDNGGNSCHFLNQGLGINSTQISVDDDNGLLVKERGNRPGPSLGIELGGGRNSGSQEQ
jgi:hypothetical protein